MAQTRPLVAMVIVVDGPVLPAVTIAINKFKQDNNNFFRIKHLKKNVGLGPALNAGLALIDTEWVMRMDSDDIALPNRAETQANQIYRNPGYDVYGGQIEEFSNKQRFFRWVPLKHEEITRRMKWRNPINHVTTVYRKAAVKSVGGYSGKFILYEDYHLWCRMMARGYRFQNSRHVFVKVRFDRCQLKGRTGLSASLSELKFQKFIDRLRNRFSNLFYDILKKQLIMKNVITEEDWNTWKNKVTVDYLRDNHFAELKEAELLREKIQSLDQVSQYVGDYFSKSWVQKNILLMDDEQIKNMEKEIAASQAQEPDDDQGAV